MLIEHPIPSIEARNMNYISEFFTIAIIHFLAVASPGPDFAITLRQSVTLGRRAGLLTSLGIGVGIFVHVAYCIVGLGVVISQSIVLFNTVKFIGAAYLVFIGISAVRSKPREYTLPVEEGTRTGKNPFLVGFLTNALNPKATLFFLSVFSVVVSPSTPLSLKAGYGIWMAAVTTLWFGSLTYLFSLASVRSILTRTSHWFDRIMGALLIGLGIKLALVSRPS